LISPPNTNPTTIATTIAVSLLRFICC
jgi:hypothetical protein